MGPVKRRHHHVVDFGLALMNHAGLLLSFWRFAFAAAVFLYNQTKIASPIYDCPFQHLYGKFPNVKDFRVFGCLAFPKLHLSNRNKLCNRSDEHIFIRYPDVVRIHVFKSKIGSNHHIMQCLISRK